MDEVLLINPRPRRKARKTRKNPSAAQLANRARFARAARARANPKRRRARRRNPVAVAAPMSNPRRRARRRNPIASYRRATRRRSNPSLRLGGVMGLLKTAAVQGAGAVAVDYAYGSIVKMLPDSIRGHLVTGPGQLTVGAAVKAFATAWGALALRGITKGYSMPAGIGALTVQMRDIVASQLPAGILHGAGLGYATPAAVWNGYSPRVGPNRSAGLGAYVPGQTPLLSNGLGAYTDGMSPLVSGRARRREGMIR